MKKSFIIFIILLTNCLYGQNKIVNVEYEIYYNTERPNTQNANLYFDESKNISIFKRNNPKINKVAEKNKEENSININITSKRQSSNYIDYKKDSLFSVVGIAGENYLISEKIPNIKWTLVDEEKLIDNNKVYKATCYFRGRNYIAWYSLDYPWKFGPWKFQGLPGLIFEIYDETKRFNWLIKNISKESDSDIFYLDTKELQNKNIQEYAKLIDSESSVISERLNAKLPREMQRVSQDK